MYWNLDFKSWLNNLFFLFCLSAKLAKKMDVNGQKASVGVIAPYRAQVSLLRKMISPALSGSDISTVDQFQGRDKDVIIYSCTKTKANKTAGKISEDNILNDWRRLNVAVTRAKARLWLVGNVQALKSYEPFKKLIEYLEEKKCVFPIDM